MLDLEKIKARRLTYPRKRGDQRGCDMAWLLLNDIDALVAEVEELQRLLSGVGGYAVWREDSRVSRNEIEVDSYDILSDRRTIRMCNNHWDFSDIYDREWRQSAARAFLIDTSLDEEWEMDECYADGGGILGILLSRRDDLQPCGHPSCHILQEDCPGCALVGEIDRAATDPLQPCGHRMSATLGANYCAECERLRKDRDEWKTAAMLSQ